MSNDDTKPKTFRSNACFDRCKTSFAGHIWDSATKYETKEELDENWGAYSVIARKDDPEEYGVIMSELYVSVRGSCAEGGGITGRRVLGKVRVR